MVSRPLSLASTSGSSLSAVGELAERRGRAELFDPLAQAGFEPGDTEFFAAAEQADVQAGERADAFQGRELVRELRGAQVAEGKPGKQPVELGRGEQFPRPESSTA